MNSVHAAVPTAAPSRPSCTNSLEHQALTQVFTGPQTGSGLCQPCWAPQIGLGPLLGNLSKGGGDKLKKKQPYLFFLAHRAGPLGAHILNKGNLPLTLSIPVPKLTAPHSTWETTSIGDHGCADTANTTRGTAIHSEDTRDQVYKTVALCISTCAVSCCQARRENPFQQKGHCAGPPAPRSPNWDPRGILKYCCEHSQAPGDLLVARPHRQLPLSPWPAKLPSVSTHGCQVWSCPPRA